jgi:hypothetical protein
MVAIPRHDDVVVATPATDVERKGEMGVRVEQRPRVDADRICCRVALDVAGIATLRRKIAAEATMVPMNFYFFCLCLCPIWLLLSVVSVRGGGVCMMV